MGATSTNALPRFPSPARNPATLSSSPHLLQDNPSKSGTSTANSCTRIVCIHTYGAPSQLVVQDNGHNIDGDSFPWNVVSDNP